MVVGIPCFRARAHRYIAIRSVFDTKFSTCDPVGHFLLQWSSALALAVTIWAWYRVDQTISNYVAVSAIGCAATIPLVYLTSAMINHQLRFILVATAVTLAVFYHDTAQDSFMDAVCGSNFAWTARRSRYMSAKTRLPQ